MMMKSEICVNYNIGRSRETRTPYEIFDDEIFAFSFPHTSMIYFNNLKMDNY
jgi:hypothetical protein